MSLASLCNGSATVERPTYTADTYGGESASFATAYSGIPCTVQPASGRIISEFERRSMQVTHTLYTPTPIELLAGDRVVFNSANYIVQWAEDQAGRGSVFAAHLLKKD